MRRAPVGPSPRGPLVLSVDCRVRSRGEDVPVVVGRHRVEIHPDWSVVVPHEMPAARRDAALGNELSCVRLVDDGVPALRDLLQLRGRRVLPPLGRNGAGRWVVREPTSGCACATESFPSAAEAAAHVRSAGHLARRYAVAADVLTPLVQAAERAHGGFAECPPWAWGALGSVQGPRGLDELWAAGVPPEHVVETQARLLPRGESLSVRAHLGVAYGGADLDWLEDLVRATAPGGAPGRGVGELVEWAAWAWGEGDRRRPRLRADWLRVGLSWADVDTLVDGEVTIADAETLGAATGRSPGDAGRVLAAWHRAGCRPGVGDLVLLDKAGHADFRPTAEAVNDVLARVHHPSMRPTRTQAAVLLGLAGSSGAAAALAEEGVSDGAHARRALAGIGIPPEPER